MTLEIRVRLRRNVDGVRREVLDTARSSDGEHSSLTKCGEGIDECKRCFDPLGRDGIGHGRHGSFDVLLK